jgi:hypothetical protein
MVDNSCLWLNNLKHDEALRYHRRNARIDVARRFIGAMKSDLYTLQAQPGIGSPRLDPRCAALSKKVYYSNIQI